MADLPTRPDHCGRLASLRQTVFGPRGRAAFARALDVSPSTYNYYEKDRAPPADLLARAAQVTGADLTWLLTGQGAPFPDLPPQGADNRLSHPAEEIIARFAETLAARAAAPFEPEQHRSLDNAAVAALRAILAQVERGLPEGSAWKPSDAGLSPEAVPVVGRTAAGLPAPWEKFFADEEDPQVLERLIARTETRAAHRRGAELLAADPAGEPGRPADASARLVQLSEPTADGIVEYLEMPGIGPLGPGAFALRVDGDSMSPRIRDGDLVVCRRSIPPQPGQTAVVKVRGRIGVTVKLWRPEGDRVHLIPINEAYDPSRLLRTDILWACRVLWVVRL
jgi:phage repressor protein C with HTH and peptisase S24 domain/transcriptional regulator with XRE-family HTH domain